MTTQRTSIGELDLLNLKPLVLGFSFISLLVKAGFLFLIFQRSTSFSLDVIEIGFTTLWIILTTVLWQSKAYDSLEDGIDKTRIRWSHAPLDQRKSGLQDFAYLIGVPVKSVALMGFYPHLLSNGSGTLHPVFLTIMGCAGVLTTAMAFLLVKTIRRNLLTKDGYNDVVTRTICGAAYSMVVFFISHFIAVFYF